MRTHCPYCALQCAMHVEHTPDGYQMRGDATFDVNAGKLCIKGFTAAETLAHPDRIVTPLVRRDGELKPATWDVALAAVVLGFRCAQERYGKDAVAVFGSGSLTNEKAYALGKFARLALGTQNFDYNGRFCMSSAAVAAQRAFGIDRGLPFPLAWLEATKCLLVAGGNPADTMPPLEQRLEVQREHGQSIVVDPRRTAFAAGATLHLQPPPGSDVAIANALLHVLIAERLTDADYIAKRTQGFDAVRRRAEREDPERVERRTGVPADDLRSAARLLAQAPSAIVLTARGVEQHCDGADGANAYINLALACGLPGRLHSGYGTLTGQANGQGGREHGQKSDQLPGYRSARDPAARAAVARAWDVTPEELGMPGLSASEIMHSVGDAVRALFVMGSNPVVSAPNAAAVREKLGRADLVVVCDFFPSETTQFAHIVLPTLQWAEEAGTVTNLEGRLLLRERVVEAPPGPRSDLAIIADLAGRLGRPELFASDIPVDVFDELARVSAGGPADYSAASYERIRRDTALYWPISATAPDGSPALFGETFHTADGRAHFVAAADEVPAAELPDDAYPYAFTTGRVREHYLSGTQTRRVERLLRAAPEPVVEMHCVVASYHGIAQGDLVRIRSRRGAVELRAKVTEDIRADTLFAAFHWAAPLSINDLTSDALDPLSRMPAFKACAVALEALVQTS